MHLSTGVLSADRRYIMVIYALQPVGAEAARETITAAVRAVFPTGRV
ncbi:LppW protein [Mycolicibacterium tokaiense]|uniref:LppW protein n=2 Tax=Mycolicibacterium TaxID=1866885 RepID=A0A378T9G9_9MYCO|nr:LppW protein [Mycolicibacterium tokaiense]